MLGRRGPRRRLGGAYVRGGRCWRVDVLGVLGAVLPLRELGVRRLFYRVPHSYHGRRLGRRALHLRLSDLELCVYLLFAPWLL